MASKYVFEEGELVIDNVGKSFPQVFHQSVLDFMTVWFGKSGMKAWLRVYLIFLFCGVMCSLAFLPHPFAITNAVGMVIVTFFNGREFVRVRGINKNMGWPHLVGWSPVLVVNLLSLFSDVIQDQKITWEDAENNYEKARFVCLWFNTAMIGISCIFDVFDTVWYYAYGKTSIERSQWTVDDIIRQDPPTALNEAEVKA